MRSMLDRTLWQLVNLFPSRIRIIGANGEKYLLRFYVKHNGKFPGIYLHHFFVSDRDRDLHNHPWETSYSLILTGGYSEERLTNDNDIRVKVVEPGNWNKICKNDFHRVDLLTEKYGCWTLFFSGKKTQDWGFKDRNTGRFIPHAEYLGEEFTDAATG